MNKRSLAVVLVWLLLVLAVASSCDLVTVETPIQLFEDEFSDYWPTISPSGDYLCFVSDRDGDAFRYEYKISLYELNSGEITQLTTRQDEYSTVDEEPAWSKDELLIYFLRYYVSSTDEDYYLCSIPVLGEEDDVQYILDKVTAFDINYAGTKIMLRRDRKLQLYDISTEEITDIPNSDVIPAINIRFLPDDNGVMVALSPENNEMFDSNVVIYYLDEEEPVEFNYENYRVDRIDFSPDGENCLFSKGDSDRLYLVPLSGGTGEVLDFDLNATHANWSSDGTIYYSHKIRLYEYRIWYHYY